MLTLIMLRLMGQSAALASDLIDAFNDAQSAPRRSSIRVAGRLLGITLLSSIAAIAIVLGLSLRQAAFTHADGMHFEADIANGYFWGQQAASLGLFNVYDHILTTNPQANAEYGLDYPPLRLAIVCAWARWSQQYFPGATAWQQQYEFNLPMLRLNTACEFISSILVFLLIRLWKRRDFAATQLSDAPLPGFCGAGVAMIGALMLWFNPAVILDAHSWPQWDVWMLPFFLGAALLTSVEWWLTAGIVLGIGAFFKGQMLLLAPLFVLWPFFELKISAMLRVIGGFAFAAAAIAFPWLHISHGGLSWLIEMMIAIGLITPFIAIRKLHGLWIMPITIIATILTWPFESPASAALKCAGGIVLISLAISRLLPARSWFGVITLCAAACVFLTIPLFGSSAAWFKIGYGYGAFKYHWMATPSTYSFPWLMETRFGWSAGPDGLVMLPLIHYAIKIRAIFAMIYAACLILSAAAAAMQSRRRDARFLAAMIAPSLCFFVLLTMMNNRYMVWAAALTSLLPALSLGMTLLGLMITAICFCGIVEIMYRAHPAVNPALTQSLGLLQPDLAWPLMLAAGILLWVAMTKSRKDQASFGSIAPSKSSV